MYNVICEGIYFNEMSIESDKEPSQELTIEKYDLDRSSGFIIGRFAFNIDARSKLMFEVTVDGKKVDDFGSDLPIMETSGDYDTTLFKWDGSAKMNKIGKHVIKVKSGLIPNISGDSKDLGWGAVTVKSEATFVVTLVKNKE